MPKDNFLLVFTFCQERPAVFLAHLALFHQMT